MRPSLDDLTARARGLIRAGSRAVLGITGPPGVGKSTLAVALVRQVGEQAAYLPMDGFHLADVQLDRLGRRDRKGAPDTFDADGYAAALTRVREPGSEVYLPGFERTLEQPVAAALHVGPAHRLVVTEGNYLLLADETWRRVRSELAQVWYLDLPRDVRRARLVSRHRAFGKSASDAREWAFGSDERNARRIASSRWAADLLVELDPSDDLRPG